MQLKDCVAVVSGGASGLGEASVRKIVEAGGKACIMDMDEKRGNALADELKDSVVFYKTDVSSEADVQAAVDGTCEKFGKLNCAINCAGVANPMKIMGKKGPVALDKFNFVLKVNLLGTVNVIRLAVEKMLLNEGNEDGEKGVIINTASVAAFDGQIGQTAYTASKAGVAGMTLPLARELASDGIRALCIAPGLFLTPMLESLPDAAKESLAQMMPFPKRLGKSEEFASLVAQICENTMLNGETIRLDAGVRLAAK